ncbi:MAG: tetratricopeptide repeat protein [Pseudomonadota bacterium]
MHNRLLVFSRGIKHSRFNSRLLAAVLPLLAVVLVVLGPTGLSGAAEDDPLAQAREYIADEKYTEASDLLRTVTRKDDAPLEAWLLLGIAYEGQGLSSRAITAYEEVMSRDKTHLDGGLGLGRNLMQNRSKRQQAMSLYKSLLKVYPDEPRLHFALGMAYNEMAEVSYAFEQYKMIKDTAPELAQQLYDAIFLR